MQSSVKYILGFPSINKGPSYQAAALKHLHWDFHTHSRLWTAKPFCLPKCKVVLKPFQNSEQALVLMTGREYADKCKTLCVCLLLSGHRKLIVYNSSPMQNKWGCSLLLLFCCSYLLCLQNSQNISLGEKNPTNQPKKTPNKQLKKNPSQNTKIPKPNQTKKTSSMCIMKLLSVFK